MAMMIGLLSLLKMLYPDLVQDVEFSIQSLVRLFHVAFLQAILFNSLQNNTWNNISALYDEVALVDKIHLI